MKHFNPGVSCYDIKIQRPEKTLDKDLTLVKNTCKQLLKDYSNRRNLEINTEGREKKKLFKCARCQRNSKNPGYGELHHRNDMLIVEHKVHRGKKIELHEIGYCTKWGCAEKYRANRERVGCQTC